jgi:ribosome-associated protein
MPEPAAEALEAEATVSKTAKKREAEALQKLGEQLTKLKSTQLDTMQLSPALRAAINEYQRIKSREARRRQRQFIGSVMRGEDAAKITAELEVLTTHNAVSKRHQQRLEQWRERLLGDSAALTEYLAEHPDADVQQLRQLIRRTTSARTQAQRATSARVLYRFLSVTSGD